MGSVALTLFFFFQAEDGIRDVAVTGVQTCALPIVSAPGLRRYVKAREIPRVKNGLGMAILSTPQGLMTDREARTARIGGELLALVDRKSTRLNSSHGYISYAVFCLKKKKNKHVTK